jgi:hypothetical protein
MGQWAVSVLGLDPLHLEATLAMRVRVPRHHQEVLGPLYRAAQIQAGPRTPPVPLPDELSRGPPGDQRIG